MSSEGPGWLRGWVRPPRAPAVPTEDQYVAELRQEIAARDSLLQQRKEEIAERDIIIRQREATIRERENAIRLRELELQDQTIRSSGRRIVPLRSDTLLVELKFGGYVVVPAWNLDVVVGIVRDGVIEPWTTSAVRALLRRGDTFLNIGANLGYYLVTAAHLVDRSGKVLGIEANRLLFPYLRRTAIWAGFPDTIRLFNCAASDVDDRWIELWYDPQFIGGTTLIEAQDLSDDVEGYDWQRAHYRKTLDDALWETTDLSQLFDQNCEWRTFYPLLVRGQCRTMRVDTLLAKTPEVNLLLLDIEGSEPRAILGAEELIRRSTNLNIIMEWSPYYALMDINVAQTEAMYSLLHELGYEFYRICHEGFKETDRLPALMLLPDKAALLKAPAGDLLVSKDLDRAVEGWSGRLVSV